MTSSFEYIDTGAHNGAWNMAFDIERAEALDRGEAGPMLRVYTWRPWCISLGRHQDIADIDQQRVESAGYHIVRRPTGGRAILHADELTYCVVMPSEGRGIMEVYRLISEALTTGLKTLVPDIGIARSQADFQKLYKEAGSIPCFSSSARYEIEFGGRKLVGSAQRRIGNAVLQHGSILIGDAHLGLADFLAVDDVTREQLRQDMRNHTVTLSEIVGGPVETDDLATAIRRGFSDCWGWNDETFIDNQYISDRTVREADEH
jgi:lipoyl(octanoyl) transferase